MLLLAHRGRALEAVEGEATAELLRREEELIHDMLAELWSEESRKLADPTALYKNGQISITITVSAARSDTRPLTSRVILGI